MDLFEITKECFSCKIYQITNIKTFFVIINNFHINGRFTNRRPYMVLYFECKFLTFFYEMATVTNRELKDLILSTTDNLSKCIDGALENLEKKMEQVDKRFKVIEDKIAESATQKEMDDVVESLSFTNARLDDIQKVDPR